MAVESKRMQQIRGTAVDWQNANPTLLEGELGLETDTRRFKVGPGAWTSLPYFYIPPPLDKWDADRAPNNADDVSQGYDFGSRWFDATAGNRLYTCVDPTLGAAVWLPVAEPVDSVTTGSLLAWPTATAPAGYLLCDGSAVDRVTYAGLFAVIGETFGPGDGSSTFNLPDGRGRGFMGAGTSPDSAEGGGAGTLRVLAAKIGAETHTLTIAQMPAHNHAQQSNTYISGGSFNAGGGGSFIGNTGGTTQNRGGGEAHPIINPFLVINWMIKV